MPTPDGPFFALDAGETKTLLDAGSIILVDVREPHEFAQGHIAGSVNLPLSRFDPDDVPTDERKRVVFSCGVGMRSFKALELASAAGLSVDTHFGGGLKGWIAAGFPVERG